MKILLFLSLLLCSQHLYPQPTDCETDINGNAYSNPMTSNVNYCVKLHFHIVRKDNGTGGVPVSRIQDVMNQLSSAYGSHYITFYNSQYDFINNTAFYNSSVPTWNNYSTINEQPDRIDIYLLPDEFSCRGGAAYCDNAFVTSIMLGGTLRNTGWVSSQSFAAHEMGHILGLPHTFGRETMAIVEFINGTNCSTGADRFCDTPATFQDSNSSPCGSSSFKSGTNWEVSSSCVWTNPKIETSSGLYYTPDLNNYMEYTHPDCMTHFSNKQVEAMRKKMESSTSISPAITSAIWGNISYAGGSQALYTVNFVPQTNIDVNIQALNTSSFSWARTSGSGSWGTSNSGKQLWLNLPSGGSSSFNVNYSSFCFGQHTYSFIHTSGWYSSYPNPTDKCFTIVAIDDFELTVPTVDNGTERIIIEPKIENILIFDNFGTQIKSSSFNEKTKTTEICLDNQKDGIYQVIINSGTPYQKKISIVKQSKN